MPKFGLEMSLLRWMTLYKFLHQCVELYVKENVREAEYDYVYEVGDDAARASNPRRSARTGARGVSIVSYYDENVEEDPDYVATYNPNQVEVVTIETGNGARRGRGTTNTKDIVESYYV